MGKRGPAIQPMTKERLLSKVEFEPMSGCWLWIGSTFQRQRYGKITTGGRMQLKTHYAHRASWEMFVGPIPPGLSVLHRCDITQCINPAHLFLGTYRDNAIDMARKGRSRPGTTRLSWSDVETIRSRAGTVTNITLAEIFNVRVDHISDIIHRRTWRIRPTPWPNFGEQRILDEQFRRRT